MKVIAGLAVLTACWLPAGAQQTAPLAMETLQVSAQGQSKAEPDTVLVGFELDSSNSDVKAAYTEVAKLADKLRGVLKAQQLPPGQAHLGQFNVRRNLYPNSSEVRDYTVSLSVNLELHDFSRLSPLLDALAAADLPAVQNVNYTLQNAEAAKSLAIADGYRRAAAEAAALAAAEGRQLAGVAYSSVDVALPAAYPVVNQMVAGGRGGGGGFNSVDMAPLLAPTEEFGLRELTVTARVDVVYRVQ